MTFAVVPPMFCEPRLEIIVTPVPKTWCEITIKRRAEALDLQRP